MSRPLMVPAAAATSASFLHWLFREHRVRECVPSLDPSASLLCVPPGAWFVAPGSLRLAAYASQGVSAGGGC